MQNKSKVKNRDDIKVIITAIAFTLTLAFWNFFSAGAPNPVQAADSEPDVPHAAQAKILLGGPAPKTIIYVQQASSAQSRPQQTAPQSVTSTGSSR